jgi:flavin-dependent dehydrogenase
VGEAIGCVAPLAGDGIVPGMKSVELLLEWWDDPEAYTQAILKEFHWMSRERKVLDKIRRNESLGLADAWVLRKNSRRMGMQIGVRDALRLLKKLR